MASEPMGGQTVKSLASLRAGMSFDTLEIDVSTDGVATVRLANDPVNAISQAMREELSEALDVVREDRVRVVVLTGRDEVFSVGADVAVFEEAADWTTQQFRANSRTLGQVFDDLEVIEKPVLAAINGTCVGGGLELALACDVRIAAPDATIGFTEHNIGLIPGLGGCSRFVHLVGPGRAKDLIFRSELFDGDRARELGLVEQVDSAPEAAARKYAEALLDKPPQALGLAKRAINAARETDLRTAGLVESLAQSTLIRTEDHVEGLQGFRDDRDPTFTGQ